MKAETTDPSTSYQWYKNGQPLSGKTHKQLIIASTVDSDQGSYNCRVANSAGSVLSHSATLRVVSVHPQPQRVKQQMPWDHEMKQHYQTEHSGLPQLTSRGVGSDSDVQPIPEPISVRVSPAAPAHGGEPIQQESDSETCTCTCTEMSYPVYQGRDTPLPLKNI